jgi:tetratricopeptide (TPR) repeat protein
MPVPPRQALAEAIAQGDVVLIVGTGVSIQATDRAEHASWAGLLTAGITYAEAWAGKSAMPQWGDLQRARLADPSLSNLLETATDIEKALGAPNHTNFATFLRETVGKLEAKQHDLLNAIATLNRAGARIATTNYDDVLAKATGLRAIPWTNPAQAQSVLRGDDNAILHLHGHWRQPETIILGETSYARIRTAEHTQALQQAITLLRTVIFIGCGDGLADPNFGKLLDWLRAGVAAGTTRHILLCREGEQASFRETYGDHPHIVPAPYGPKHEDLAGFLAAIAPVPTSPLHGRSPRPAEPAPLPLPEPTPFILGRDADIATLTDALAIPARILINGTGGIGKTTLAQSVRTHPEIATRYPNRPVARLETATTAAALRTAITLACGLPATAPFVAALTSLAATPTLLVLDNLEFPFDADQTETESLLADLCAIPGLALLATIRGTGIIRGSTWSRHEAKVLVLEAARALFLHHAGAHFEADPHLSDLLPALGGLPLAIELVALRAAADTNLSDLWAEYQAIGSALAAREGELPGRLSALSVSIELSLASPRMKAAGRRLFALLGALPAGIADRDRRDLLGSAARSALEQLHGTGLAQRSGDRLDLLPPIRDHARRRLRPLTADQAAWPDQYLKLVSVQGEKVGREGGASALARLAPEMPNITAAFPAASGKSAIEAIVGYADLASFSGLGSPAPIQALASACYLENEFGAAAQALFECGRIESYRSDYATAERHVNEALALFRRLGDGSGEGNCNHVLGEIARARSDYDAASTHYAAALPIYRRIRDVHGEAGSIQGLGEVARARSDLTAAAVHFNEALLLFRGSHDVLGEAITLHGLAETARLRSDYTTAAALFGEALLLKRRVGSISGEAHCIIGQGEIAYERSDLATAISFYNEALSVFRKFGYSIGEASCIRGLGRVALARSSYQIATARFDEAMSLFRSVGNVLGEASCMVGLGEIAHENSNSAEAEIQIDEALSLYRKFGELLGRANCIHALAGIALKRSESKVASNRLEEAQSLYRKIGNVLGEARSTHSLGEVDRMCYDEVSAVQNFNKALWLCRSIGDVLGEANCLCSLGDLAWDRSNSADAIAQYHAAIDLYQRIPQPFRIGHAHVRLAQITSGTTREMHLVAAREAWLSISRPDLVAQHVDISSSNV